jgi:hypothetical protein
VKGKGAVGDAFGALFLLVVLYMLVRPSSPAPAIVKAVTDAFNGLVHLATQG